MSPIKAVLIFLIVSIPSCAAGGLIFKMGYDHFNGWAAVICSVLALWFVSKKFDVSTESYFQKMYEEIGLKPDFIHRDFNSMIIIDLEKERFFLGKFKDRDTYAFADVTSITGDAHVGVANVITHRLIININDFKTPRKIYDFGNDSAKRDAVFAKFRVALKMA